MRHVLHTYKYINVNLIWMYLTNNIAMCDSSGIYICELPFLVVCCQLVTTLSSGVLSRFYSHMWYVEVQD